MSMKKCLRTCAVVPVLCLLVMLPAVFSTGPATARSSWTYDREKAVALSKASKCADLWELLWTWSKTGNWTARHDLALSVTYNGLIPPLSRMNETSYRKSMIDILMYGMVHDLWYFRPFLDTTALPGRELHHYKPTLECMRDSENRHHCINSAVREGVLPEFDALARRIDRSASEEKATCSPTHHLERFP
ncbi:hypothetical protein [Aureimonas pseudogalii]|uniref:Uncharacterized protein n=1 Tax=Aureimonas pseudogalii TaxID=1744844 RepID=A0A7W6EFX5_9HYPH|nr:hypothetical protein [Aureimonas pseudogalii]MBB3997498.1 hypothetical protein [Aureimonas pseudogalii]